ncbi:MAG: SH3 domain-containing protein [Dinghuibacter sp.]|nr:SH3 domain-containing protein [Dinghuibacter sp.]
MLKSFTTVFSLLLFTFFVSAQDQPMPVTKMYVAHKPGLSIREKPDVNAKVLAKIPYGTQVSLTSTFTDTILVRTDGFSSYFHKVTYGGKTGYIIGAYLLNMPPPKPTVKTLTDYLAQLSPKAGAAVEVKRGSMSYINEGGSSMKKQLYKNGAEHHQFTAYEYGSETWIIPEFSVQQAWLLLRLIPDWKHILDEKTELPAASKKVTRNNTEFDIKVEKENFYGPDWFKKIRIEYTDGAAYFIEIFLLENQVIIFNGSGV